jgi:hypothetical protein
MMEQMAMKDYNHYQAAAEDKEVGGGVNLPSLLNEDAASDNGVSLMEPLIPHAAASTAKIALEQQMWPSLQAAEPSTPNRAAAAVSSTLVENMMKLAIKHNIPAEVLKQGSLDLIDGDDDIIPMPWPNLKKETVQNTQKTRLTTTPWRLPADYKSGDPLPKAPIVWASGAASKELFKDAKPTPLTQDWEARLREKEKKDHKSNILHHQFWNPTHEDYDPERFYDPMIEKYKCPFPGCE